MVCTAPEWPVTARPRAHPAFPLAPRPNPRLENGDPYLISINNANIIEALNLALADTDGTLKQVSNQRGAMSPLACAAA